MAKNQRSKKYGDHLFIPDPQVKPGYPINHLEAAGQLVVDLQPAKIICAGDFWDMPSLCSYDMGKAAHEKMRYVDDIDAGNAAMAAFLNPIEKYQSTKHGRNYRPEFIFTMGNHENRVLVHEDNHPYLIGALGVKAFNLKKWRVYKFLELAEVDGIYYCHYFYNAFNGRPIGGTIQNMLNKINLPFTMGHVQRFGYDYKPLPNGQVIHGLIAGAFYQHNERYKGPQGNHHFRGLIYKHNVHQGSYDLEAWSLERVLKTYG